MRNPWLDISDNDYVGHMSSPSVMQRPMLSRIMGEALEAVRPKAMLVVGCSTGNGLDHVNPEFTSRVDVIDLNQAYLDRLIEQFPHTGFAMNVQCADLADVTLEAEAFDLVHAALVLEYINWPSLIPRVASALKRDGTLSVVLQLPSAANPSVTPTAFTALQSLESIFNFVDPDALIDVADASRLKLSHRYVESLPTGKSFEVMRFAKSADSRHPSASRKINQRNHLR